MWNISFVSGDIIVRLYMTFSANGNIFDCKLQVNGIFYYQHLLVYCCIDLELELFEIGDKLFAVFHFPCVKRDKFFIKLQRQPCAL